MIQFSYQGIFPSTKTLKDEIDKVFNHQKEDNQPLYLIPFIEEIIRKTNHQFNTVRNYTTTKNHLKTFEDQRGKRIKISDIDLDFYDEFVRFFHDKGSSVNTLGTNIKNLKVFLGIASDRDIPVNSDFRKKRFKVVEETADTIYLNPKEIEKLLKLDLSAVKKWERVRDLFIIGCFTGLRFSDYNQVTTENIQQHDKGILLKVRMTKTGQTVVIPLRNEVLQILKRYDNQLPKVISNQKMNEYLKDIGEKAKINELVNVTESEGIFHKQTTVNKWKLISTHTARRSFATNAFLSGVDSLSLMKITGHRTEKSFHKYIKVSQQENALKLASHPYFIGQLQIAK
jgi:site-specific recombinase XerD